MRSRVVLLGLALTTLLGCGEDLLVATFTSEVVQRRTCRIEGDRAELCERDEVTQRLTVTLVEEAEDRVELYGVPRDGASDRALIGTRDNLGGFLFEDVIESVNGASGCTLRTELQLALEIDPEAPPADVGFDICVPLVGRETRTTTVSAECDDVNDPPIQVQRILRRRWERAVGCGLN
jgi:hypothetical protein